MSNFRLPLVILAAGLSTRYDELKQLDDVGPSGEALMDYGILDGWRVGVEEVVLVVRPEIEEPVREHVEALVGGALDVTTVLQRLDDLPAGAQAPPGRERPWGTAHALWSARDAVGPGPFLLMNADDFYGAEAFRQLGDWAERVKSSTEFSMVPYRLAESLSEHGGVSRAICQVNHRGWLDGLREVLDIQETPESGSLTGRTADGEEVTLHGDEIFCANLWGLTPRFFSIAGKALASFLAESGDDLEAELVIADAIRPALGRAEVGVRLLEPQGRLMGITHPGDRFDVMAALERLVREGAYPEDLRTGFSTES